MLLNIDKNSNETKFQDLISLSNNGIIRIDSSDPPVKLDTRLQNSCLQGMIYFSYLKANKNLNILTESGYLLEYELPLEEIAYIQIKQNE